MRIDLSGVSLNGVPSDDKTKKVSDKAARATSVEDKASLSVDTVSISSLEAKAMSFPEVRQDKVNALRTAIQNREYKVEPDKIAQAMIEQNKK